MRGVRVLGVRVLNQVPIPSTRALALNRLDLGGGAGVSASLLTQQEVALHQSTAWTGEDSASTSVTADFSEAVALNRQYFRSCGSIPESVHLGTMLR